MKRSRSSVIGSVLVVGITTSSTISIAKLLLFNFKHVNNPIIAHIRNNNNYNNNTLTSRLNTTPRLLSQQHQPSSRISTLHFNSHHHIIPQRHFSTSSSTSSDSNPPQEEEKGGFFGGIFSSIASKIKKVVKGDKEQAQPQPTSQQSQAQTSPNLSTQEKKDHEEEEAKAEKDINEGLFTLETYRLELRKAQRVAKVKGYYDSIKDKINSALGKGEESEMKKQLEILESQLALLEAMTPEERNDPTLITMHGFKRKTRIAQTTNQTVEDVNRLIAGYNRAHDMVLIMTKAKKEGKEIPKDMEGIQKFLSENPSFLKKYAEKKGGRRR